MSKVFTGAAKKKDAEEALENRPVLVLFYMEGCAHCEANKPAWDEAKKNVSDGIEVIEIEAEATPDNAGVSGFPTMIYKPKNGKDKVTTGEKHSGKEIEEELELPKKEKKKGGRRLRKTRGRTFRGLNSRRNRKLGYRTLRHDIPFV